MMNDAAGMIGGAATDERETQADVMAAADRDRRRSKRMPYACTGMAAAYLPPDIPPKEAFWMIRCRDLSRGGVAFYSPIKPPTSLLVVSLGSLHSVNCLLACRVSHCTFVGNQTNPQYLVGCEFVERLG